MELDQIARFWIALRYFSKKHKPDHQNLPLGSSSFLSSSVRLNCAESGEDGEYYNGFIDGLYVC